MAPDVVVGIDSSTQSCKVVAVDAATGEIRSSRSVAHPDGTEVDPRAWGAALDEAAGDTLEHCSAVSVGGQQHGLVTLDADGEPVRPALLWNDVRSAPQATRLVAEKGAGWWANQTGVVPVAASDVGGDLVRLTSNVRYDGPGGQAEMLGLYFADAGQHLEHRLFVDHNQPKTRSNVDYKGALQGEGAHSVWVGEVLIRKVAEGIDTYESNRNLVLTDGCRADSVPNLEIETGEIEGAGHASTTGRFDDQQLFYLQSRGIHEDDARRLVVHGFFNDIIHKIGIPQIEEKLLATVEAELEKSV